MSGQLALAPAPALKPPGGSHQAGGYAAIGTRVKHLDRLLLRLTAQSKDKWGHFGERS